MKKKFKILIPVLIISSILLLLVAALIIIEANGLSVTSGRVLINKNGQYIITGDGICTVVMNDLTISENPFGKLTDGDKILIIHNDIAASYPGYTGVYFCMKIGNGEITDIDESTLKKLTEMGLITYGENNNEPSESLPEFLETSDEATIEDRDISTNNTVSFDIDNDGIVEECSISHGPTSGLFTVVITALTDEGIKYKNTFSLGCNEIKCRQESGTQKLLFCRYNYVTNEIKEEYHDIFVENNCIVIANLNDYEGYWGDSNWNWNLK